MMDGITPRVTVNLIVDNADKDKNKKVYNLNKNKKIILNPSYLYGSNKDDTPQKPPCPALSKLKKTNVIAIGNSSKETENTFCPSRSNSSIWNRIKGSWPMRSGKSITIDSECKIIKITQEKDSASEAETTDSETHELTENDIQDIIKEVLRRHLHDYPYDHEKTKNQSAELSLEIHDRIKEICNGFYKIAVNVFIGETRGDGIETATQCIWSPHSDCVVSGFYKNSSVIAIATVLASYSRTP